MYYYFCPYKGLTEAELPILASEVKLNTYLYLPLCDTWYLCRTVPAQQARRTRKTDFAKEWKKVLASRVPKEYRAQALLIR
jgi:hypothetical protein